jgi:hypothetical protein
MAEEASPAAVVARAAAAAAATATDPVETVRMATGL